jgi:T-complex protein 1 subunit theta
MAKSMNLNAAAGLQGMLKDGHRSYEGLQGAVLKNIEAAKAIAGMVRTSMGPNGMNKLVLNHLEKIIVTSDCATILKELEIQHPAAKMLVLASEMQENEYGDQTNFVGLNLTNISSFSHCSLLLLCFSLVFDFRVGNCFCWRIAQVG